MTAWWLAVRYFGSVKRFFNLSTTLAVLGMTIGVASLVVSMAVFTGYSTTLQKTVQDAVGHLLVVKRVEPDSSTDPPDLSSDGDARDTGATIGDSGDVHVTITCKERLPRMPRPKHIPLPIRRRLNVSPPSLGPHH